MSSPDPSPVAAAAAPEDLLRYWLAALREEEAVARGVRQHAPSDTPIDLDAWRADVNYVALRARAVSGEEDLRAREEAVADVLLRGEGGLPLEVWPHCARFLEHCTVEERRRGPPRKSGDGRSAPEGPPEQFLTGFPVLQDGATRTLATLLWFQAAPPRWLDADGASWPLPGRNERPVRRTPAVQVVVGAPLSSVEAADVEACDADDATELVLPYEVNRHALVVLLQVAEAHLDQLLARLVAARKVRPAQMILALVALLEVRDAADEDDDVSWPETRIAAILAASAGTDPTPRELQATLGNAAKRAAERRGRLEVWDIGLYWRSSGSPTGQLQREIAEIAADGVREEGPLGRYLRGVLRGPGEASVVAAPLLGLRQARPLTADQQQVGEQALGGVLTCASGPPGTGKTELILNLAAHTLIEATCRLAARERPPRPMVVTSTNNRAVVNVLEGLLAPGGLPLVLRVGNMQVLGAATRRTFEEVATWLASRPGTTAEAMVRWERLAADLLRQRAVLRDAATWPVRVTAARTSLDGLRGRRVALEAALAMVQANGAQLARRTSDDALAAELASFAAWLRERGGLWEAPLGARELVPWRGAVPKKLEGFAPRLKELGLPVPTIEARPTEGFPFEELADRIDAARTALVEARPQVPGLPEGMKDLADLQDAIAVNADQIDEATAVLAAPPPPGFDGHDPTEAHHALFRLACEAREAWATAHRDLLLPELRDLTGLLGERASMFKSRLRQDAEARRTVNTLFPVMGCTLLSLGNMFHETQSGIGLVVIDEAGQCHPAYVVGALSRASRALVLGDVHQTVPILQLEKPQERRILSRTVRTSAAAASVGPARVFREAVTSAQHLASLASARQPALMTHFRCAPEIIAVSDALCGYGLDVRTAARPPLADLPAPLVLHDVRGAQHKRDGSWLNHAEAERVIGLVRHLLALGVRTSQLAVLTPYNAQEQELRRLLRDHRVRVERPAHLADDEAVDDDTPDLFGSSAPEPGVALGTVHRFQGGERDVVLFSTVVTHPGQLGFLNERVNLVNVAVSRARRHFILVGHAEVLASGPVTGQLIAALRRRPSVAIGPRDSA
jgi:hypothetical protein